MERIEVGKSKEKRKLEIERIEVEEMQGRT